MAQDADQWPKPAAAPRSARSTDADFAARVRRHQQLWPSTEADKTAGLQPSTAQAPSIAPNQASLLSLLCLIAGSMLASSNSDLAAQIGAQCLQITAASAAAPTAPAKDDATSEPDPPEVAPDEQSASDKATSEPDGGSPADSASAAGKCPNCANCASKDSEATATSGQRPAPADVKASPAEAAPQTTAPPNPASEPAVADDAAATDKTAAVDEAAPDETPPTTNDKTSTDVTSAATPQPATEDALAADAASTPAEDTPIGTPSTEDGATTPDNENAVQDPAAVNATGDVAVATTETTQETAATEESSTASTLELPDWFLGNNVILFEDLAKRPTTLQLFKAKAKSKAEADEIAVKTDVNAGDGKKEAVVVSADAKAAQGEPVKDAAGAPASVSTEVTTITTKPVCTCNAASHPTSDTSGKSAAETTAREKVAETDASSTQKPVYQLHQDIYDEALDLLSAALQPPANSEPDPAPAVKKAPPETWISQSSFLLQSPRDGSLEFLDEVALQIGRDAGADVIMLELDDLEDLCHHFWHDSDEVRAVGPKYLTSPLRLVGEFFGYSKPEEKSKSGIACILGGADKKRESQAKAVPPANGSDAAVAGGETSMVVAAAGGHKLSTSATTGSGVAADILQAGVKDAFDAATKILQAAIREAFAAAPKPENDVDQASNASTNAAQPETPANISDKQQQAPAERQVSPAKPRPLILLFRNVEAVGKQTPLQRLCEGINTLRREKGFPVVIVGTAVSNSTSENRPTAPIGKAWDGMQLDDSVVINVSPRNTRRAVEAMKQHAARAKPRAKWRLLRRSVRVMLDQHPTVSVDALYPSGPPAGESVVDEIEDEKRRQTLTDWDDTLSARVVRQVSARAVRSGAVTPADVFSVMERVMKNQAILNKMDEAGDDEFVGEEGDSEEEEVTFGGPVKKSRVKPLLESISESCSDAEKEYFDCVIDTDAVSSTAQDIHMDQSLIDSLKQLLSLRTSKPYGLLAKEAINGAILYGPPGTGKTHLARVVAASSGTNLIVATPADIQNMWVGETEKRIKALFSLGAKLAPCVIFLDEGDSVFGRRSTLDRDWQRKAMSQFLMEMDGLVSRKKAPFLIVATNRPGDIDDSVCRRLPHTLHIGMPTAAGRRAILDIYLKDEKLDKALNLDEVASDAMTKGFSGSDIRTLCVQAAMAAHKSLEAEAKEGESNNEGGSGAASQKRVITMEHFRKALERTRPSVTRESLLEIERFTGQQDESGDHRAMYI